MGSIPEETNQQWTSSTKTTPGYDGKWSIKTEYCTSSEREACLKGLSKLDFIET